MLFRPKFCANCGVKIERPEWYPWTSRRFCTVCEVEYKGHEVLPKIGASLLAVFGVFGIWSMINRPVPELRAFRGEPQPSTHFASLRPTPETKAVVSPSPEAAVQPVRTELSSTFGRNSVHAKPKAENDQQVSFCGAETKKGTPCTRRVKGNTRCFQHVGMPAMNVPERSGTRAQIEPKK